MAAVVAGGELVLERGEGCSVWDVDGQRYLDATASLWYCNVGSGRTEIGEAVATQMAKLPTYSTFDDLVLPVTLELAERVAGLAPVPGSKVFLTSGGSDSIDTATKMVRRYWQLLGETGPHDPHPPGEGLPRHAHGGHLARRHPRECGRARRLDPGRDRGAVGRPGLPPRRDRRCRSRPRRGVLLRTGDRRGRRVPAPEGYLEAARAVCRDTGVLFVADEVITGFGRCGDWFASTRFGLEPDIVTCAKGITSGYLPLGAVLAAPRVAEPFWAEGAGMWRHGYTYSGHAAVAAAALVNIDILEREELPMRAKAMEGSFLDALKQLTDHDLVEDVRGGVGLLAAVQLRQDLVEADPALGAHVGAATREAGVLVRPLVGGALAVSPPLTIDDSEIKEAVDGIRAGLDAVA